MSEQQKKARHAGNAKPAPRGAEPRRSKRPAPSAKATKPAAKPRRDEVSTILHRSAVAAAALVVVLGVLSLFRSQINLAYTRHLIAAGRTDAAQARIIEMERSGYPESRVEALRFTLVEKHLEDGDFDMALSQLNELPEGEARQALATHANYLQAEAAYAEGRYDAAAQQFYQLGDYQDSASRLSDSRCAAAVAAYLEGREADARQLLLRSDDAAGHIEQAVQTVAKDEAKAREILALELFQPESLARLQQAVAELNAAREGAAREGAVVSRIAVGEKHTVGVRTDGAVLAAGDNRYGQCDVQGWTNIVQVACGARHTLGLRLDGTVAAAGDNSFGQCDVSGWTNVAAIAANAYGSFALMEDGTVAATRMYQDRVQGWRGVSQIAGGGHAAGCLLTQGGMLATHPGPMLDAAADVDFLSVCGTVAAGILPDGTLASNLEHAPAWTGLARLSVGPNGMLGVTEAGEVRLYTFRTGADEPLPVEGAAREAACGGAHWAVLTEDGHVFAFGANDAGQCDVSGWLL